MGEYWKSQRSLEGGGTFLIDKSNRAVIFTYKQEKGISDQYD